MREKTVEKHLHDEVTAAGGTTRKFSSASRPNNADRIVIWKNRLFWHDCAAVHFAECKAPGKKPRPGQAREHVRLQKLGCIVVVLDTKEKVDRYVERNK